MNIEDILVKQRRYFQTGATREISFRVNALKTLRAAVIQHEEEIFAALNRDLNKSSFESYATEVGLVLEETGFLTRHLPSWAKPKKVRTPLAHFLSFSYIYSEPYGVSLIMSPWNYPFALALMPLIGSISAGNCSVVKPSAYSPATSSVIAKVIGACFDEEFVAVAEGGRKVNETLLDMKYDHIFFTGSVSVGKTVMQAAARNLTPVTLELGGKSPCIVDREVKIDLAAKRITWGKFLNAGQTCVAPDYLIVHRDVKRELLTSIKRYIEKFYGDDPCGNPDYPRIINHRHFQRLQNLMTRGDIIVGGTSNEERLAIAPTVIDNVSWEFPVMQEEIFGPILPVLEYENLSDVITTISSHSKPLSLYFFSANRDNERRVLENLSFGGGCVNDTVVHVVTSHMPFGGVGNSGMGSYHGRASFDTFSHKKSILKKSLLFDLGTRYPPHTDSALALLRRIIH